MQLEASETKVVPCNLCGASDAAVLPRATARLVLPEPLRVVRCRRCGFMYVNPRLTRPAYARLSLNEDYFQAYQRGTITRVFRTTTSRFQLDRIERRHPQRGRLLEIGCATGEFLMEARQAGWQVWGVEPSPFMAAEARRGGLEVATDFAPENYAEGAFDVVHMNHVLEHVPEPSTTLRGIYRVLAPTGLLVIEVPYEFGGWFQELYPVIKPGALKPNIHHLSFFTPRTLARCLAGAGFSAEVKSSSPKKRAGRSAWRRWALTALAYSSDAFNRGENIEAFATRGAPVNP
jgi:SAM-dependent methyltransferase